MLLLYSFIFDARNPVYVCCHSRQLSVLDIISPMRLSCYFLLYWLQDSHPQTTTPLAIWRPVLPIVVPRYSALILSYMIYFIWLLSNFLYTYLYRNLPILIYFIKKIACLIFYFFPLQVPTLIRCKYSSRSKHYPQESTQTPAVLAL